MIVLQGRDNSLALAFENRMLAISSRFTIVVLSLIVLHLSLEVRDHFVYELALGDKSLIDLLLSQL